MYFKWPILFFCLYCADINGVQSYRFDYTYSKKAKGWLKLHQVPATWSDAKLICHAEGSVLASPLTKRLQSAIIDHVMQTRGSSDLTIFSGVHARISKGDYASIEGVPLSHLPITWAIGEPDNYKNSENCLVMLTQANGTMADVRCSDTFPYVCYRKKCALVISECGTLDSEYKLDARTGSCYKFHRRGLTWSQAFMTCAAEGAHLAIINNDVESVVLRDLYAKNPDNLIFSKDAVAAAIGFHDWGERGTWMTIHGETLQQAGFSRFDTGQPDNLARAITGDEGQYCGSIFRNGNLNDIWCNVIIPFICEKKPDSLLSDTEDY